MERNAQGDRVYSSGLEAVLFLEETTRSIVAWLHECRSQGARLPAFQFYRSRLNDISNITRRFIVDRERKIARLMEELDSLRASSLCPRCGQPRRMSPQGEDTKE